MSLEIKNLLFDLGGVIIDLDRQRCIDAFAALGLPDAPSFFGEYAQKGPFGALESGAITEDEFHRQMRSRIPVPVTDAQIDEAFQLFLIGIPARRLRQLRRLRKSYGIYLLSNTNPIMWNDSIARMFRVEGLRREDYFDGMVTSFEARCMKPAPEIFEYTARTLDIDPAETLFYDDSQRNVAAARECGYHAHWVNGDEDFAVAIAKCEKGEL